LISRASIFHKTRYANAARSLAPGGITYNENTDVDGAIVFRHACGFGFEGIVSKRLSAPYRSGKSRDWLKVKNLRMRPQRHLLVRTHG
jgi:ATP-dependent DNA ligase